MMSTGLKALLFAVGGVTAAAGTAYVTGALDSWLGRTPPVVAALPETPATSQPQEETPPAADTVPQPDDPAEAVSGQPAPAAPGFDILRVEPDGSLLVAGTAAAGALVELLAGADVLGGAEANGEGEFVVVLDEPLAPGDYQLMLRAMLPDGTVMESVETAVVSVPEMPDGQVLALVEEPGEPSQLITVTEVSTAAEDPATVEETVVAEAPPVLEDAAPQTEAVQQEIEADVAEAALEEPAAAAAAEPGEAAAEIVQQAPAQAVAAQPSEDAEAPVPPAGAYHVAVEAVEIEGGTIFVAGQADPGRTVRVYADELLLGDAVASEAGRFLVEAQKDLPVGSYVIRADLLEEDGSVLARAAVPFEREPGEAIAAVAPSTPAAPVEDDEAQAAETATEPATGAEDLAVAAEPRPEPEAAVAGEPVAPEAEQPAEVAAAEDQDLTAPALQSVDGSVIIRRGDNLWRISRRVYGKGVRYSAIYLANQDQISDPNRIWPGQVFSVPSETAEGEQADMEAIADQAVAPETQEETVAQ